MVGSIRLALVGFVLAIGFPSAGAPVTLAATRQISTDLRLHRWKFRVDGDGHRFIWVQLANTGSKPVQVTGIATQKRGPWLVLNQKLQPQANLRRQIQFDQAPTAIWVDCNEGLLHFDLPTR